MADIYVLSFQHEHCGPGAWVRVVREWASCKTQILSLIALACLFTFRCSGTVLVAVWTPDGVYFRADSKLSATTGEFVGYACKIRTAGDVAFGYAGLFSTERFHYLVPNIIKEAITRQVRNVQWFEDLAPMIAIEIAVELKRVRRSSNASAVDTSNANYRRGEFILVGRPSIPGSPLEVVHHVMDTSQTDDTSAKATVADGASTRIPVGLPTIGYQHLYGGQTNGIVAYRVRYPEALNGKRPADVIKILIGVQEKATPKTVGGPISILYIPQRGHMEWIEKGRCEN